MSTRRAPSPSLVISLVALFVALGGTSYAALKVTGKNVQNSSLTGADLRNGSVKSADVGDGSLLLRDFKASQRAALRGPAGPAGANGANGATGPAGPQGPAGPEGTTLGYALVTAPGDVIESQSSGITDDDVSSEGAGIYCFQKVPPGTTSIVVSASNRGRNYAAADVFANGDLALSATPSFSGCTNTTDRARVTVWDLSDGALANEDVYVWFEG